MFKKEFIDNLIVFVRTNLIAILIIFLMSWTILSAQSTPSISFSYVPNYGNNENLRGKVINGDPEDFAVAVYIEVEGNWWIKPEWDNPSTKVNSDGTWICDITTGGIDETATTIVAFLIPSNYIPPLASGELRLPKSIEETAIAKAEARRRYSLSTEIISEVEEEDPLMLDGICYGPFRDNENPDMGVFPLLEEIKEDFSLIPAITTRIRTYSCTNTLSKIPMLCQPLGVDCYVGIWLGEYKSENQKEVEASIRITSDPEIAPKVKAIIVGNEVLLRKDLTEEELISYIREVKKTNIPVTTAEIWSLWIDHPNLAKEVDFITVHIHPYWEGKPVETAAMDVVECWKDMKKRFPGKRIVIGETGWPSKGSKVGKAIPNPENQARFFKEFTQLAKQEGIEYFYFELFDEAWKKNSEGDRGGSWGIYNSNGSIKENLKTLVPSYAARGLDRPARKVSPVEVTAPLIVYKDSDSTENSFKPSGWMGDTEVTDLDEACEINPHSGKTCIKINYQPKGLFALLGWSGIYWQFPLNNWGDYPGYRSSGISKLTFWVRGAEGNERSEFKVGGIDSGKTYKDSFGPVSSGILKLTSNWQKVTIPLEGKDTTNLIGGFCWVTNPLQNIKGCVIYLDDIQFEP